MTARQRQIGLEIRNHLSERGYAISIRELGQALGLSSSSTTHTHLAAMRRAGYVDWVDGDTRTVHLTDLGRSLL